MAAICAHGQAGVHIEDRRLQLGDGIYEVTAVADGRRIDEEEHLDRMERSLREIGMGMPMGRAALKLVMREMIRRNRVRDGLLYLQVTRGTVQRDHPIPEPAAPADPDHDRAPLDPEAGHKKRAQGIGVITTPDQRWARLRHQDGAAPAQSSGQDRGAQSRARSKPGWWTMTAL